MKFDQTEPNQYWIAYNIKLHECKTKIWNSKKHLNGWTPNIEHILTSEILVQLEFSISWFARHSQFNSFGIFELNLHIAHMHTNPFYVI